MPPRSEAPLRKVTLNLFEADCAAAEAFYGRGWSEQLRELWHSHIVIARAQSHIRTLGDLFDDD